MGARVRIHLNLRATQLSDTTGSGQRLRTSEFTQHVQNLARIDFAIATGIARG
jgi:hypothetical protein